MLVGAKRLLPLFFVQFQALAPRVISHAVKTGKGARFSLRGLCLSELNKRLPLFFYDPYGIRTRVTAVKGRCLNHLTNGPCSGGEGGI